MRAGLIWAMLATASHAQTAAPEGIPRNLTVAPPGATDVALAEADVPSGRFSGPWQTGALDGFRFRRFPDATASVGADHQMGEWRIDIACAPKTGACDYAPHGTPPEDAGAVARRLGGWLVRLPPPPPPPPPEPEPEASEPEPAPPVPEAEPRQAPPEPLPPEEAAVEPEPSPPAAVPTPPPEPEPAPAPPPAPQPAAVAPVAPPPELDAPPAARARTESLGPTLPLASAPPPVAPVTSAPRAVATTGPTVLPPVASQPLPPRSPTPRAAPAPVAPAEPRCACVCDLLPEGEPMARLQALLAQAGYDPGPIDGSVGPRTRAAAREAFGPQVDIFGAAASLDLLERLLCSDPQ